MKVVVSIVGGPETAETILAPAGRGRKRENGRRRRLARAAAPPAARPSLLTNAGPLIIVGTLDRETIDA